MTWRHWVLDIGLSLLVIVLNWQQCSAEEGLPDHNFRAYSVIYPKLIDGRTKRSISSTQRMNGHLPSVTVAFQAERRSYLLDLQLNKHVVSRNAPLRYQLNGTFVTDRRALTDDENCYYSGVVRGSQSSTVALSTCEGISGLLEEAGRTLFLSPTGRDGGAHYLYSDRQLTVNRTCGVAGSAAQLPYSTARRRRAAEEPVRPPRLSDAKSRYVELVLVVDHKVFEEGGAGDLAATVRRTKQIANIVNALYSPLNIFVALVGVEVWTEQDAIELSENGDTTLNSFLHYRSKQLVTVMPNDNAQLLTGIEFQGGVVGKALKGPICTLEFSGGVNMDHSKQVSLVATTVAHEMGHNFGMEHDSDQCDCEDDRCIMSPSSSSVSPTHWSSCSLTYLAEAFGRGMDYCLRNQPVTLYDSPVCGNGFVEPGEQCDCGLPTDCTSVCCDPATCRLRANATCATGRCCDPLTCALRPAGVRCRGAEHECDLSEYCTGHSQFCPDDRHAQNGQPCQAGQSYCYAGVCRTRDEQCRLLWGPSGSNSVDSCYHQNSKGTRLGNCGYDLLSRNYTRCRTSDVQCGMLHCAHFNGKLEFGMESAAIISASFINIDDKVVPCRTAVIDLGLGQRDPGLVPNGAPCGHRKLCVDQQCVPLSSVTAGLCPDGCSDHGVCNDLGHCHCYSGWGPPLCSDPGDGGSVDSGPALDDNGTNKFVIAMFVIFLGLMPAAGLVFCCLYFRRNNLTLKEAFLLPSLSTVSRKLTGMGGAGAGKRRAAPAGAAGGGAAAGRRASVGLLELPRRAADAASTGSDRDAAAPLTSPRDQLASSLMGTFSGFSIKPIQSEEPPTAAPTAASQRRVCEVKPIVKRPEKPPPPALKPPAQPAAARTTFPMKPPAEVKRPTAAAAAPPGAEPLPPGGARTTFGMKPHVEHGAPKSAVEAAKSQRAAAPPVSAVSDVPSVAFVDSRTTFGMSQRPSADKHGVSDHAESDAAARPDKSGARTTFSPRQVDRPPAAAASAPVSPSAAPALPARPVSVVAPLESVPDARTYRPDAGSKSSTLDSQRSGGSEPDTARFGGTLSRVSGIFKRSVDKTPCSPEPGARSAHHPNQSFKAAKIDRDRLRQMEISAPIPQSVHVPESALPVGSTPSSPQLGAAPAAAAAAESCSGGRAPPPPPAAGRPVSYPARPSAPPPRPPPSAAGDQQQLYDDCNVEPAAAHVDSSVENIYSTIEERGGGGDDADEHLYALPPDAALAPTDGGLLSEIAAELQSQDLYAAVDKQRRRPAADPPPPLYQNVDGDGAATAAPPAAAAATKPVPPAKPRLPSKPGVAARKPNVPAKRPPFK